MEEIFERMPIPFEKDEMSVKTYFELEFRKLYANLTYLENLKLIKDKFVQKALDYIFQNYQDNIELKNLAAHVGLSPQRISQKMKKKTLCTFREILYKVRFSHAIKMMIETDELLESIAFSCGFGTRRTFNREFRQFTGFVPSEFRKLYNTHELIFVQKNKFLTYSPSLKTRGSMQGIL
ncbi:MAG: hypothetical protein BGO29_15540 [Bacteroidales bacterium 36-12]|nr:MAG: hypothetical protein BGO29_15540 [Bacteroidales bacterium 36-12]